MTEAIGSLPTRWQAGHGCFDNPTDVTVPILARADSAGTSHDFVAELVRRNIGYSLGFAVDARVGDGLLFAQDEHWEPARNLDGTRRENGYVIELTDLVELDNWGAGCLLICRRERPHPGAQLSLFGTINGWRHTCFSTNTNGDTVALETRHRGHAHVEDRVRAWKDSSLANSTR